MKTNSKVTGRTKFAIRFSLPPLLPLENHFGIGLNNFSPSTACSIIPHLFLTTLPSAIILKLIWMMSWKGRSNTAKPAMIRSLRLGLLLSVFLTKPVLPKTKDNLTSSRECFNTRLSAKQPMQTCFVALCVTTIPLPQPPHPSLIVLHHSQRANVPSSMNMTAALNVIAFTLVIKHKIVPWASQWLKVTRLSQ